MMRQKKNFALILSLLLAPVLALAEDAEIKLNSADGSTKLIVQDNASVTVFSADSDGNLVAAGTMSVAGSQFAVGSSTFVVRNGAVGINWITPEAALQVNGGAKFLPSPTTPYLLTAGPASAPYSFFVASNGAVGMGNIAPSNVMDGAAVLSLRPVLRVNNSGALGIDVMAQTSTNSAITATGEKTGVFGGNFEAEAGWDDTLEILIGLRGQYRREESAGAGNVQNAVAVFADAPMISAGGGTITNSYGVFIASQAVAYPGIQQTRPYALYSEDQNSWSHFAGNVGIGTATPSYRLVVSSGAGYSDKLLVVSTGTSEVFSVKGNGEVYTTGRYYGDGSGLTGVIAAGDSLGSHIATKTLDMAQFPITGVSSITISGDGIRISTAVTAGANGIWISTTGAIVTVGRGQTGSALPNSRGVGAVDLQTLRNAASQVASGPYSVISGGENNQAMAIHAAISGGQNNKVWMEGGTIGGGISNEINGSYATVSGGESNIARNYGAVVSGGFDNYANGDFAMIPGGMMNYAGGEYSFAAGALSSSTASGAFTWSDSKSFEIRNAFADRTLFKNEGGFMVVGSTVNDIPTLPANQAMLDIISTGTAANIYAQVWRNASGVTVASMTSQGVLYATLPPAPGDHLGNHVATTSLNMASFSVVNVTTLAVPSTVTGLHISTGGTGSLLSTNGLYINPGKGLYFTGQGNGTVAGNARGFGAVDLQTNRTMATQVASGMHSSISGGSLNTASSQYSAVGGGYNNTADGYGSVVSGGANNQAWGDVDGFAVVSGGDANIAIGDWSVISGGQTNRATGYNSAVSGGSGNTAGGDGSMVSGGMLNTANGYTSWAGGYRSSSTASGAFTWSDSLGVQMDNTVANRTVFKNAGGFLVTGSTNTAMTGTANRGVFITGNGLVGISTGVPAAALDVVATGDAAGTYAQIWRNGTGAIVASMTATGVLYATMPPGTGDNLGTHTATQNLNMAQNAISNVSSFTVAASGLLISTGTLGTPSGLFIAVDGSIYTAGLGNGTYAPGARGVGAVDLQTRRMVATDNVAGGEYSTIAGGQSNKIVSGVQQGFIGAGDRNIISGVGTQNAAVVGGYGNNASGSHSFIGGGYDNAVSGAYGTIAGGQYNRASSQFSAVIGGYYNLVSDAFSEGAVILGGKNNSAANAMYSLTAGYQARSSANGAFTWTDYNDSQLDNNVANRTVFKNRGGFLVTGSTNTAMTGAADRGVFITGSGLVGISTGVPYAALDVVSSGTAANVMAQVWRDSNGAIISSMSATGVMRANTFIGNGSGLTGVSATDNTKLPLAGGVLTGQLILNSSTLTVSATSINIAKFNSNTGGGLVEFHKNNTNMGHIGYLSGLGTLFSPEITNGIGLNGINGLQLGDSGVLAMTIKGGKVGVGKHIPAYSLDVSTANSVDAVLARFGVDGVLISTGGAVQTTGLGYGFVAGNARGLGAVDLQTRRTLSSEVASGPFSVVVGGEKNSAVALYSSVSGGYSNTANNGYSTVSGGSSNYAGGQYSAVSGGYYNQTYALKSFIGGGENNWAGPDASWAVIAGGAGNKTTNWYAAVAGGNYNMVYASNSFIGGGVSNVVRGTSAVVAGGELNTADEMFSAVVGGRSNVVSSSYAFVGGGRENLGPGYGSFVGGGFSNHANAEAAAIAGGANNTVSQWYGAVAGGLNNTAGEYGAIGGGYQNSASGTHATVAGGINNQATGGDSFIGGGDTNQAGSEYSAVAGGKSNMISGTNSSAFIGGGESNSITGNGQYAVVGGGYKNSAFQPYSGVLSGSTNTATAQYAVAAGGLENTASGDRSVVGGGWLNTASSDRAVVAGGHNNTASGLLSTVSGGFGNKASVVYATIGGGASNTASGDRSTVSGGGNNTASGLRSTVSGGSDNTARGSYSWAGGFYSSSTASGAFTWADSQGVELENSVQDRVRFKARGGFMVSGSTKTADPGFYVSGDGRVAVGTDTVNGSRMTINEPVPNNLDPFVLRVGTGATLGMVEMLTVSTTGVVGMPRQSMMIEAVGAMTAGSLPSNVWTKVVFGGVTRDPQGEFNNANDSFVAKTPGTYLVTGQVIFDSAITGGSMRGVGIAVNGTIAPPTYMNTRPQLTVGGLSDVVSISYPVYLQAGGFVQLAAFQNSGAGMTVTEYMTVVKLN